MSILVHQQQQQQKQQQSSSLATIHENVVMTPPIAAPTETMTAGQTTSNTGVTTGEDVNYSTKIGTPLTFGPVKLKCDMVKGNELHGGNFQF